jgi:hypothetical protein
MEHSPKRQKVLLDSNKELLTSGIVRLCETRNLHFEPDSAVGLLKIVIQLVPEDVFITIVLPDVYGFSFFVTAQSNTLQRWDEKYITVDASLKKIEFLIDDCIRNGIQFLSSGLQKLQNAATQLEVSCFQHVKTEENPYQRTGLIEDDFWIWNSVYRYNHFSTPLFYIQLKNDEVVLHFVGFYTNDGIMQRFFAKLEFELSTTITGYVPFSPELLQLMEYAISPGLPMLCN